MNHYKINLELAEGERQDPEAGDLLAIGKDLFVLAYRPASKNCWAAQAIGQRHTWNGWQETAAEACVSLEVLPVGSTITINRWRGR